MKPTQLLLVLAAAFPVAALAADEPAPARSVIKPIQFVEYDLPNGLHVILHENHAVPVISTYVLYKVGSKNERPDRTGLPTSSST